MSEHNDHDHHHGISHIASKKVLLGTWITLMILTLVTVLATRFDLGGQANLIVAMVIATIKASLVCMFFMHLRYDKLMHTVAVVGALLFAILFVGFTLMDSSEYQHTIIWEGEAAEAP